MQSVDPFGYKPQVMRQGSSLNQRDRHDQIVLIKSAQLVSHAQDSTSAALQRGLVDQVKHLRQFLWRRGHLFDLDGKQFSVPLQDQVDFSGILIPVIVQEWLLTGVLIGLDDFRYGIVFQQCPLMAPSMAVSGLLQRVR